ncbi:MAG: hypothetical protein KKI09_13340 [Spirochaetes bacterium]|nr:hypothetical protein [Spirochaetota bacterium]MBU0956408.1 hypothetical protein [Spirochaetota bacterium]
MTKKTLSPDEALRHCQNLIAEGKWQEVFDFCSLILSKPGMYQSQFQYFQLCAAARLKRDSFVYDTLKDLADAGFWYSQELLLKSPSFQGLQEQPVFKDLLALHQATFERARGVAIADPLIFKAKPENLSGQALPAIMLHGNASNAEDEAPHWRHLSDLGCTLAAPESGQEGLMKSVYNWDDRDATFNVIRQTAARLAVDPNTPALLAGFSMGGGMAFKAAIHNIVPCRGLILFGPYLPESPAELDILLKNDQIFRQDGRIYILAGEQDELYQPNQDLLHALKQAGYQCGSKTLSGGHHYPANFAQELEEALAFVLGG